MTVQEPNIDIWYVQLPGPVDTPYQGALLECRLIFPFDYPFKPPEFIFDTPIYHCNVSENGLVCMDVLHDLWTPALTARTILISVQSLLTDPNPDDALNADAAGVFVSDKAEYDARARSCVLLATGS